MANRTLRLLSLALVAAAGCGDPTPPAAPAPVEAAPAAEPAPPPPPPEVFEVRSGRVARNKTLAACLDDLGLSAEENRAIIAALKGVFDFRKVRVGDQVRLSRKDGRLETVEIRRSELDEWLVTRAAEGYSASKRVIEIETRRASVELAVRSSVYEATAEAGEDPSLAVEIADVLAWDIDFYRDVRTGDRIRVVVDKVYARGRLLRYGDIHGVRYDGSLVGSKRLMRYTALSGETSFFDEKGTSAKKPFLKSPLKFVHITSRYGGRKHPVSGYQHNHQGVDFAAAIGTPVWAVGDGVVTRVVRGDRGGGNYLFLRHTNGYETGYLHLSRFADGIHVGSRVSQKQVIAYTGNTGTSTGPHLHYAMKRGGHYMNPLAVKLPRAEPLTKKEMPRFQEAVSEITALLDAELVATLVPSPGT